MRLAQAGDRAMYETFLRDISPMIRNFFRKYSYSSAVDADELLQETLLAIHRASHTYNSDRPIKPWIYAIASYKLKDCLRAVYRKRKIIEIDFADVEHEIYHEDPRDEVDEPSLEEMLCMLPEKQKAIVYALKIKGNSLQETANELGMSVAAVKVAAHRAYQTLIKKHTQVK